MHGTGSPCYIVVAARRIQEIHDPANDQIIPDFRHGQNGAWAAFLLSQSTEASFHGCVTQPAHAALAGRLAAVLNGRLFEAVPEEILETIGRHDAGWSEADLAALEEAGHIRPISFTATPPAVAVQAWRRSISDAAGRSSLSVYVVRSHFCLLAPCDADSEHDLFRREQEAQLCLTGIAPEYDLQDLDRFVAFLGFCDLLSLHLCSGWPAKFALPLGHPAHPAPQDASSVAVSIEEGLLHVERLDLARSSAVYVNGWETSQSGSLRGRRYEWMFH